MFCKSDLLLKELEAPTSKETKVGVVHHDESLLLYSKDEALKLSEYNEFLENTNKRSERYDIVEVRKLSSIFDIFEDYNYDRLERVWSREDERYIVGVHFGCGEGYYWKLGDVDCKIGDVVEVEMRNGKELVMVVDILTKNTKLLAENPENRKSVIKRIEL